MVLLMIAPIIEPFLAPHIQYARAKQTKSVIQDSIPMSSLNPALACFDWSSLLFWVLLVEPVFTLSVMTLEQSVRLDLSLPMRLIFSILEVQKSASMIQHSTIIVEGMTYAGTKASEKAERLAPVDDQVSLVSLELLRNLSLSKLDGAVFELVSV